MVDRVESCLEGLWATPFGDFRLGDFWGELVAEFVGPRPGEALLLLLGGMNLGGEKTDVVFKIDLTNGRGGGYIPSIMEQC